MKWLSRKLLIFGVGCGTLVALTAISAMKPVTGWQITIITCVGLLVFAYLDKEK
jgi:hypothetical protein